MSLSAVVFIVGVVVTGFLLVNAALSYGGRYRRDRSDMRLQAALLSALLTLVALAAIAQVGL